MSFKKGSTVHLFKVRRPQYLQVSINTPVWYSGLVNAKLLLTRLPVCLMLQDIIAHRVTKSPKISFFVMQNWSNTGGSSYSTIFSESSVCTQGQHVWTKVHGEILAHANKAEESNVNYKSWCLTLQDNSQAAPLPKVIQRWWKSLLVKFFLFQMKLCPLHWYTYLADTNMLLSHQIGLLIYLTIGDIHAQLNDFLP